MSEFLIISLLAWLTTCAWQDYHTGQVSNLLTLPPLGIAIVAQLIGWLNTPWWIVALIWALAFYLWQTGKLGGADAKAWMTFSLLGSGILWSAYMGLLVWYAALAWAFDYLEKTKTQRFPGFPGYLLGIGVMMLLAGFW